MQDTNYKRLRSSWLLLLVYVPMLLAVTLHRHDGVQEADDAFYCEDCATARACLSCPAAAAVVIICDGLGWRRGHG